MVQRHALTMIERKGAGEPKMRTMNKARCSKVINHAQIDRSLPNYMKPTSCSDARKQQRQVSDRAALGSTPVRVLRRKVSSKSLKISLKKVNRATCSSTLKDSKFPEALELSRGATEAEGTSAVRVCPYQYCSLNGHHHDDLPPLKCFLVSRRKVIQAHKCMKQKGISPFRKRGSGKDLDTGQGVCRTRSGLEITSLMEEIGSDFFIEIYAKPQERLVESVNCNESLSKIQEDETVCPDVSLNDDDVGQSSEFTVDDLEAVMDFLEFVSCDQEVEEEKEKFPSSIDEEHVQGKNEAAKQTHILESIDMNLGEEADHPFADFKSNFSEDGLDSMLGKLFENYDDDHSCNSRIETISAAAAVSEEKVEPAVVIDQDGSEGQIFESVTMGFDPIVADEISEKTIWMDSNDENATNETAELSSLPEVHLPTSTEFDDKIQIEAGVNISGDIELIESNLDINDSFPPSTAQTSEGKANKKKAAIRSSTDDGGSDPNLRMIITRKAINDELEQSTEFNMRSPNFLPEQPDPETEKVDLKHQMMDERKNSEEWMIDYALQQAVTKLGPARKQKVALLVEAFETVIPLPACEKSLRDATQSFSNPRHLQACS